MNVQKTETQSEYIYKDVQLVVPPEGGGRVDTAPSVSDPPKAHSMPMFWPDQCAMAHHIYIKNSITYLFKAEMLFPTKYKQKSHLYTNLYICQV